MVLTRETTFKEFKLKPVSSNLLTLHYFTKVRFICFVEPYYLITCMNIFWNILYENVFSKKMIYKKKLSFRRKTWFAKIIILYKNNYDAIYECM